jgi:hypothetical protein
MKRRITRKTVHRAPANKKFEPYPPRKAAAKVNRNAQMTNYLLEEHPEFCEG